MSNRWAIGAAVAILMVFIVASIVATLKIDLSPKPEPGKRPVRTQNLGEGIRVAQHGLYGVDLVSIGKAHMRKLRKGPFTIGAINELVLEDVTLALPEELWKGEAEAKREPVAGPSEGQARGGGPKAMLGKLGIAAGNLKMGGKMPRFSALAIRNLRVSRIEGTNAVPWFAAGHAKAERTGLALYGGWSVEGGRTNRWKEAVLLVEPTLTVVPQQ